MYDSRARMLANIRAGLAKTREQLIAEAARVLDSRIADRGDARAARLQALDPATVCISGADAGIAESGTLVLRSRPEPHRRYRADTGARRPRAERGSCHLARLISVL